LGELLGEGKRRMVGERTGGEMVVETREVAAWQRIE